jgi:hypothetical protein
MAAGALPDVRKMFLRHHVFGDCNSFATANGQAAVHFLRQSPSILFTILSASFRMVNST